MSKDRTRRIVQLGAQITELRSQADQLERDLEKIVEQSAAAPAEKLSGFPTDGKRKVGVGKPLTNSEIDAAVIRYLMHHESASVAELCSAAHVGFIRMKSAIARLHPNTVEMRLMDVSWGAGKDLRTKKTERLVLKKSDAHHGTNGVQTFPTIGAS